MSRPQRWHPALVAAAGPGQRRHRHPPVPPGHCHQIQGQGGISCPRSWKRGVPDAPKLAGFGEWWGVTATLTPLQPRVPRCPHRPSRLAVPPPRCQPPGPPGCPRLSPAMPLTLAPGLRSPELRRGGDRHCPGPSSVPGGDTKWVTHPLGDTSPARWHSSHKALPPPRAAGTPSRGCHLARGDPNANVGTATQRLRAAPPPCRAGRGEGGARAWHGGAKTPSWGGGGAGGAGTPRWGCHRGAGDTELGANPIPRGLAAVRVGGWGTPKIRDPPRPPA